MKMAGGALVTCFFFFLFITDIQREMIVVIFALFMMVIFGGVEKVLNLCDWGKGVKGLAKFGKRWF